MNMYNDNGIKQYFSETLNMSSLREYKTSINTSSTNTHGIVKHNYRIFFLHCTPVQVVKDIIKLLYSYIKAGFCF